MKTIALVCPRFGEEIIGGSERLILNYAKLLSSSYKVEVLSSGAKEYETWLTQYPLGRTKFAKNVDVIRFPSKARWNTIRNHEFWEQYGIQHPRSDLLQLDFDQEKIERIKATPRWNSEQFVIEQGPDCPDLYQFLSWNQERYKKVIFTPYLYPTTYLGIDRVENHKVLILMAAHHEPHIYFPCYRKYASYRWLVYFKEEVNMLNRALDINNQSFRIIKPSVGDIEATLTKYDENKVVFLGRASGGKGFPTLVKLLVKYRKLNPNIPLTLQVIGDIAPDAAKEIENHKEWILPTGPLPTQEKNQELSLALCLVNPSVLDSFGLVNLEAARLGVPVLLNSDCPAFSNLANSYPQGFMAFSTRDQDNVFVQAIQELRNKDVRLKRSAALTQWSREVYGEEQAKQSLIEVIEE